MAKFSDKYGKQVRVSPNHNKIIEDNARLKKQSKKAWLESAIDKSNKLKCEK